MNQSVCFSLFKFEIAPVGFLLLIHILIRNWHFWGISTLHNFNMRRFIESRHWKQRCRNDLWRTGSYWFTSVFSFITARFTEKEIAVCAQSSNTEIQHLSKADIRLMFLLGAVHSLELNKFRFHLNTIGTPLKPLCQILLMSCTVCVLLPNQTVTLTA